MQMTQIKKSLSRTLCMVLIAVMALFATACSDNKTPSSSISSSVSSSTSVAVSSEQVVAEQLGEGATQFFFTVTDKDGNESHFDIHTDKATVGEALLELELIEGEDSQYGLYVKSVNGITADYDKDGVYWAFYADGEYAASGVDATEITEGSTYAFKVE